MDSKTDILVIEDDPFMRDLVVLSLQDAGYRVCECTGKLAQPLHESVDAKVIIVDLNEPKHRAKKTIEALRTGFPAAAIIAMSGYFGAGAAMAGAAVRQLGVDWALAKPFACHELVASVRALLEPVLDD
jgi:DNA-binding response OmpR family regulator